METERCPFCDWPMALKPKDGCVPGNCSFRPREGSPEWKHIQERRAALKAQERDG